MFEKKEGLAKVLEEYITQFEELQKEYNTTNRHLEPIAKSDLLEEILMKTELILVMLMKFQRRLLLEQNDTSSYMLKSQVTDTLNQVREYIKNYQGIAFSTSEVLRSVRIKIENLYELQKLDMSKK